MIWKILGVVIALISPAAIWYRQLTGDGTIEEKKQKICEATGRFIDKVADRFELDVLRDIKPMILEGIEGLVELIEITSSNQ